MSDEEAPEGHHPLRVVSVALIVLSVLVGGGVAVWAIGQNRDTATSAKSLAERIERESDERRDQTCALFERDHLRDVQRLRATYEYLAELPATERLLSINRTVLAGLPALEDEARTDRAPEFCDQPNVGLPEPDPVIPRRPAGLNSPKP